MLKLRLMSALLFVSLITVQDNTMLKLIPLIFRGCYGLITVQDNTMLKLYIQTMSSFQCLITVQDNTMLKLRI